jgi:hypothetical protein
MRTPFKFATAAELVAITGRHANNLDQLLTMLREADAASIFHHTYQTLHEHHFLVERYPNDFADWVHGACGEPALAERLAAIDLRAHRSLAALRGRLVDLVEEHLRREPASRTRPARAPFHLCMATMVVTLTGDRANTIPELRALIGTVSTATIHHHFITARLRLDLSSNDFSAWLKSAQHRPDLARRLDRIDVIMQTPEGIRESIAGVLA